MVWISALPLISPAQNNHRKIRLIAGSATTYTDLQTALENPEKVYRLDLSGKNLKEFPKEVFKFPNLGYLNLNNNKISIIPPEIKYLRNIYEIYLSNNKIKKLPDEIGDLAFLEKLVLYHNKLLLFPVGIVGLKRLTLLDVTRNHLSEFELDYARKKLPNCTIEY